MPSTVCQLSSKPVTYPRCIQSRRDDARTHTDSLLALAEKRAVNNAATKYGKIRCQRGRESTWSAWSKTKVVLINVSSAIVDRTRLQLNSGKFVLKHLTYPNKKGLLANQRPYIDFLPWSRSTLRRVTWSCRGSGIGLARSGTPNCPGTRRPRSRPRFTRSGSTRCSIRRRPLSRNGFRSSRKIWWVNYFWKIIV